jgi:hypothetical protein
MRNTALRLHLFLLLCAASLGAHATFHLWRVTQLFSNADGSVQFIELVAYGTQEQHLTGHTVSSSQGSTTHTYTFKTDLPGDTGTISGGGYYGDTSTTFKSMLIATEGFAALHIVTPDYVVPNGFLFTGGGTLNYGEGADTFTYPALPTDGKTAWNRDGSTGTNAAVNFAGDFGNVTVSGVTAATPGSLSGLWWNASESGWGIDFTQRRNILFAAWYTYDASGNPKWYVASSCEMASAGATSGTCSGQLFDVTGPNFFGGAFDAQAVKATAAGTLSVNFKDANNATMTYTLGTQTRTVPITRQPISSGSVPGVDYTDLWWNPNESGWGMAIAQQGSIMFLAWYVYDNGGKPVWYVASACAVSGSGCSGSLFKTTGPPLGPTFDATQVHAVSAGTVSLSFSDANNGTLTYTVNGVTASKAITRQLF